jgi:hypothetical protein
MALEESTHVCACGGNCGCQENLQSNSSTYLTREEYVARLEQYLVELKAEITSVEEELVSLRQTA